MLSSCQIKNFNNLYCLDCKIPSSDKSINDKQYSSFFHLKIKKSDPTDAVLVNTITIPLQKLKAI